jgi:hypothetical protein
MVLGFKIRRQDETMPLQPCGGNVTIKLRNFCAFEFHLFKNPFCSGLSTLYAVTNDVSGVPHAAKQSLEVASRGR